MTSDMTCPGVVRLLLPETPLPDTRPSPGPEQRAATTQSHTIWQQALFQTMSRARAATLALAMVVGASAAGVMKTCRDMNASAAPLVPPPLPAAASSLQFHEVERLRKRSSTVIWTHCGSNYTICQSTVPRWRQYARSFGYDLLVLRDRNPSITGIATHAWDRVFVAQQLLGRGDARRRRHRGTRLEAEHRRVCTAHRV